MLLKSQGGGTAAFLLSTEHKPAARFGGKDQQQSKPCTSSSTLSAPSSLSLYEVKCGVFAVKSLFLKKKKKRVKKLAVYSPAQLDWRPVSKKASEDAQENSSPMRWHDRPTLRLSFTTFWTASWRPWPRWSNRQPCCSGSR